MSGSAKRLPAGGELDVAFAQFGEAQQLQRFGDGEQIVDLKLQAVGQGRQIGLAVDRAAPATSSIMPASVLVETVGRAMPTPRPGNAAVAGFRGLGPRWVMRRVDLVDQLAEFADRGGCADAAGRP